MSASVDMILAALADPDRRRAVELLGESPRRAGELASALALPAPAMSRHLRVLKEAGIVEESPGAFDARVRVYALKDGAMVALKRWIADMETLAAQVSGVKADGETRDS